MTLIKNKYILAHLSSAEQILAHYEGLEPFPVFIKAFFRDNKKFGSRDRKEISHFCYSYFRLGKAVPDLPIRERILIGQFLCTKGQNSLLEEAKPEWQPAVELALFQKIDFLRQYHEGFSIQDIFPFADKLSDALEKDSFIVSHFIQPELFLRLRPGREAVVRKKLTSANISFMPIGESALAVPNTTKLDILGEPDKEFVIQDLSSQRTSVFFPALTELPARPTIWDACAGSGGKSIMAHDLFPNASLFVSDERETILFNLKKRFAAAGIRNYTSFLVDLTETNNRKLSREPSFPPDGFDLVIVDVPCTGSGTWGRNPWEMVVFRETEINHYTELQQKILQQVMPAVKKGGFLLYITCSVYQPENEGAVDFIVNNSTLKLLRKGMLEGYEHQADTMFAALFTLPG